jgi:CBS domain containing-hemolysin-like protein
MTRDLILANIDDNLTPIEQLRSIFVRPDIRAFDHSQSLLPILKSFQENEFKLAIVTEVPPQNDEDGELDPKPRVIGVVSQEDIVEDILKGEIEDEYNLVEMKN